MMYEESLRVPFLVRYPEKISAGSQSNDLVTNCDYAPTILEYAGVEVPSDIQGRSLVPLLGGNAPEDWRPVFYYQHFDTNPNGELANCGVRTKDFKLIWYNHNYDHYQLFDVNKDPLEVNDIYEDPDYAETVETMKTLLRQERENVGLTDELEAQIFNGGDVPGTRKKMNDLLQMLDDNTAKQAQSCGS